MNSASLSHAYLDPEDAPGKRAILTSALELFASRGIEATSVRDIGEAAGLTNPALFKHFSGKEALGQYLFERIYRALRHSLPEVNADPFQEQLRATLAGYLQFIDVDMQAALFLQETLRRFWPQLPAALRRQSLIAHFRALLKVGVTQGVINATEDPSLLLAAVLGLLGQLARQTYFNEMPGPATSQFEAVYHLALRILCTSPPTATSIRRAKR